MSGSRPVPIDTEIIIYFSDPSIHHDKIILVEGTTFHVISTFLSQFCKFFDHMYNGISSEGGRKTTELLGFGADDFEMFLRALYPPNITVCDANLACLMRLSSFLECSTVWRRCMIFLKNNEEFKKYNPRDIFDWSAGSDSIEIKMLIENDLIERYGTFDKQSISQLKESLELSVEFEIYSLKEAVEKVLTRGAYYFYYKIGDVIKVVDEFKFVKLKLELETYLVKCLDAFVENEYLLDALRNLGMYNLPVLKNNIRDKFHTTVLYFTGKSNVDGFMSRMFHSDTDKLIKLNLELILVQLFREDEKKVELLEKYLNFATSYGLITFKSQIKKPLADLLKGERKDNKVLERYFKIANAHQLED